MDLIMSFIVVLAGTISFFIIILWKDKTDSLVAVISSTITSILAFVSLMLDPTVIKIVILVLWLVTTISLFYTWRLFRDDSPKDS